ncbi:MAG: hypothetical protein M1416_00815 [Candidatus Pacearchaeota archaeon]|nr:hypothetical protein [Candidatus Pacearchaeota archaeon]
MTIEKIANKYWKEGHPEEIYSNTEMDEMRRKECLCVNCDRKNDKIPYSSCPVAKKIYDICVKHDMAMAITKCGATDEKGDLLYKPFYPVLLERQIASEQNQ